MSYADESKILFVEVDNLAQTRTRITATQSNDQKYLRRLDSVAKYERISKHTPAPPPHHPRNTPEQQQEVVAHEFWDADGISLWYDIFPSGALGKLNTTTGVETRYDYPGKAAGPNASVHYVITPDGKRAIGDGWQGSNPNLVIYHLDQRNPATNETPVTPLCDLRPNYENKAATYLEPNPHLTPDGHWVLFTAHLKGTNNQIIAVEVPPNP